MKRATSQLRSVLGIFLCAGLCLGAEIFRAPGHGAISVSINPGAVTLQPAHTLQFSAQVIDTTNQTVTWAISPNVGNISGNGMYMAPFSVSATQVITVTATSAADPSKSGAATITLQPPSVGMSVSPATAALSQSQTQLFTATVPGTENGTTTWSLSPSVGTISSAGLYTAPSMIAAAQTVTVIATSVADPTNQATAHVILQPTITSTQSQPVTQPASQPITQPVTQPASQPVSQPATQPGAIISISLDRSAVSLSTGQNLQFNATVTGTSNQAVIWSLNPQLGNISSSGLYTAPSTITGQQTVIVTAESAADPTKSASASVALLPSVGISLNISNATLSASNTQQFTATVTGSTNQNVVWSLSPQVGNLSGTGLYTSPASITAQQQVIVMATAVADPSKSVQAIVTLTPPPSQPVVSTVTLPVEVIGPDGTTASVGVNVPTAPAGNVRLSLRIHGLRYQTEASVEVNNSGWLPLNDTTVTLLGNAAAYGGIGGGFSTFTLTMNLPAGIVVSGANSITFRFNGTDGRTSGFRVLALNFLDGGGNPLIPSSAFVQDDPNTWQPPSTAAADIAAGKNLWYTAALTVPTSAGPQPIQAHCTSCHAEDGRDLKYFNYSNNSIRARSLFHGLTAAQGNQIASYIRSLNVPNPGRPWNPPYQPGPGLDSQPVSQWAAGAGIDAVLDTDADMLPYLLPGGSAAGWAATQYLNTREMPLSLQFPDWNSWLPAIHPMDAFGSSFTSSTFNTIYSKLRSDLMANNTASYKTALSDFGGWFVAANTTFLAPIETSVTNWDANNMRAKVYSAALWQMVKLWELNQEFGLEGMPQVPYGSKAEARAWYGQQAFNTSPNMLHIPPGTGLGNGSLISKTYLALIWYQVQLVLNDGNGFQQSQAPIDYPYVFGFVKSLNWYSNNTPQSNLLLLWFVKSLQEETEHGVGPEASSNGWQPTYTTPEPLIDTAWQGTWSATSATSRAQLMEDYLQSWFAIVSQFSSAQFYAGGWASSSDNPATLNPQITFGGEIWFMLPRFRYFGVSPALTSQISQWAATIWPLGNWALNSTATCNAALQCTSD